MRTARRERFDWRNPKARPVSYAGRAPPGTQRATSAALVPGGASTTGVPQSARNARVLCLHDVCPRLGDLAQRVARVDDQLRVVGHELPVVRLVMRRDQHAVVWPE